MSCEYCGRDLPLIVENKWCSEFCKYACEVYEQGEYVVNLFNGRSYRKIANDVVRRHKKEFSKAFIVSKFFVTKICNTKNSFSGRKRASVGRLYAANRLETNRKIGVASKLAWRQPKIRKKIIESQILAQNRVEVSNQKGQTLKETLKCEKERQRISRTQRQLVANGTHNWPQEKPVNNPTERIFDFFFAFIFLMNWNHNFKSLIEKSREFELDFVSWLLRFNVEANEPYHDEEKDKIRDQFIVDSKELDFTHRYTTEYAITNMIDVVKTVYTYCNQQREKYKLFDLPILEFDNRWNLYCFQMQELLKEWYEKKSGSKRFKVFRDKKREADKQWLSLLEETSQKYSTNFVSVYREILEKNLKLDFKNVTSIWRNNSEK